MSKCLICETEYQPFVDFGDMPIANAFAKKRRISSNPVIATIKLLINRLG